MPERAQYADECPDLCDKVREREIERIGGVSVPGLPKIEHYQGSEQRHRNGEGLHRDLGGKVGCAGPDQSLEDNYAHSDKTRLNGAGLSRVLFPYFVLFVDTPL